MAEELSFELSSSELTPGGVLEGAVLTVGASEKLQKAKALVLFLRCDISGSGTSESLEPVRLTLAQGPISSGMRYPFKGPLPDGLPRSWDGRYVKVVWTLTAELDVPWATDPKTVVSVKMVPRSGGAAPRGFAL